MKTLLFLLFPLLLHASWQLGTGTGAYMGAWQLQTQWESETRAHHIQLSYGLTRDEIIRDIQQYTFIYQWSPLQLNFEQKIWDPLLAGPFATYTDHPHYYFESYDRYNNKHYYDVTNLRWGLRLSTQWKILNLTPSPLAISIDGSLLEKGLMAYFNNPKELDVFKFYWSLGFSIRYEFF